MTWLRVVHLLRTTLLVTFPIAVAALPAQGQESANTLNRYVEESLAPTRSVLPSPGSLYLSQSQFAELARDPRAAQVGDLITIRVLEQASALSSGAVSSSRSTEADYSVSKFLGAMAATRPLPNLAQSSGESTLEGQGSTSRQTSVTANITAYVSHVMPNGNLVIDGLKEVVVNSERQLVAIRGVVRPVDLAPDNSVSSDRVAFMALTVNGKGGVNDAIRRPNLLVRLLKGILPF